jgi:VanZ family protein
MGLIFYLSAQPDFPRPGSDFLEDFLGIGAHICLFAVLAVLWGRALHAAGRPFVLALLFTLLYALLDEFHQSFVPGRTADPLDLLWDGLGAALGLGAWAWWKSHRAGKKRTPPVAIEPEDGY